MRIDGGNRRSLFLARRRLTSATNDTISAILPTEHAIDLLDGRAEVSAAKEWTTRARMLAGIAVVA